MLLAIDVGNTNICFGLFDGHELVYQFRCATTLSRTRDEYTVFFHQMLALKDIAPTAVNAIVMASVVPPITDIVVAFARKTCAREPLLVGPGTRTGMPILYDNPKEVGSDRIINAIAAYDITKCAVIVVDFGTATTFDCISPHGEYIGGAICPGIQISSEALFSRASRLTRVEVAIPPRVVGHNTTQSMQSGIVFGYASLVDGMVQKIRSELGFPMHVLATGGLAHLMGSICATIDCTNEQLTMQGLRIVYERNVIG